MPCNIITKLVYYEICLIEFNFNIAKNSILINTKDGFIYFCYLTQHTRFLDNIDTSEYIKTFYRGSSLVQKGTFQFFFYFLPL